MEIIGKLKKPVRYEYLDFSTVSARRRDSEDEVRLNRRLAPHAYLGTAPLTRDVQGYLHLEGKGTVVDWLVKMHRLPADRMLDYRIERGIVRTAEVRKAAQILARFYEQAPPVEMTPDAYRAQFERELRANPHELIAAPYRVPVALAEHVTRGQLTFLKRRAELFDRRVAEERILEAHGDLRPEHICLTSRPVIFDCLEFSRALRMLDAANEPAFLAHACSPLEASSA